MLGSGGMVVMDEDTCMVDMARRVMHFYAHESCGGAFLPRRHLHGFANARTLSCWTGPL